MLPPFIIVAPVASLLILPSGVEPPIAPVKVVVPAPLLRLNAWAPLMVLAKLMAALLLVMATAPVAKVTGLKKSI